MSTTRKPDGGPAFPLERSVGGSLYDLPQHYAGMTLRDYFAAKADIPWNSVLDTMDKAFPEKAGKHTNFEMAQYRASMKYIEADAMIEARKDGAM